MYRISVIIPFYKGNVFLMELKHCLDKAAEKLGEKIEVIIVNDSPEIEVADDVFRSEMYDYILINNEHNVGIHKSRVIGLERANGLYILFLDQDDKINENFFVDMIAALVEDDSIAFVYANGVFEDENGTKKIILNSYGKVIAAGQYDTYLKVGNLLASPGQCLIRKSAIPDIWKQNIMTTNCADDYLLWILILKVYGAKYVNKLLYEHISTGKNVSSNKLIGYKSDLEVLTILEKNKILSDKERTAFRKRCVNKFKKENGEPYNKFDLFTSLYSEKTERLKMKLVGYILYIKGKRICEF